MYKVFGLLIFSLVLVTSYWLPVAVPVAYAEIQHYRLSWSLEV
jgi:hypothetical protein